MRVKILADLTKYNRKFTLGAIGYSDMVPIVHPNICWQLCYNVRIDGYTLAVGESSLEVVGKDDDKKEAEINTAAQLKFTMAKLELLKVLQGCELVVVEKGQGHLPSKFHGFIAGKEVSLGDFSESDPQRIYARIVPDLLEDSGVAYAVIEKGQREAKIEFVASTGEKKFLSVSRNNALAKVLSLAHE